jgi:hypothetical protein
VVLLFAITAFWAEKNWPFTSEAVARSLEQHVSGHVVFGRFRKTYFPPGCVADDIRVVNSAGASDVPAISARNLIISTTYHEMLARRIAKIKVVGLHLPMPRKGVQSPFRRDTSGGKPLTIDQIEANEADLELPDKSGDGEKTAFAVHQLVFDHLEAGSRAHFRASFKTEKPLGEVKTQGVVGTWNTDDPGATPISGIYEYAGADLSAFKNMKGILASKGKFDGNLASINAAGSVDVPQFHVDGAAQNVHFVASWQAVVDGHNADVEFRQVTARVGRTTILATGTVTGTKGVKGKTARAELTVNTGRLEDLLNYFSTEKKASMTGAVRLRAHAELPPGPGFLKKIRFTGDFGVAGGKFSSASKQESMNDLSASGRGENVKRDEKAGLEETTVVSNLKGHVDVRDGVAALKNVSFEFPGSVAAMSGTFALIPRTVDLHGTLTTNGSLPQATSGVKSLMLKVAAPFLKKNRDTVVPFAITGNASHPAVGLDLTKKTKL